MTRSVTVRPSEVQFSIIIPVFNRELKLVRAIESALALFCPNPEMVEIVVVDDASTDRSAEVARELGANKVLKLEQNIGVTGAKNRALGCASGEILIFLDSDDELLPDALERIRSHFERHPSTDILFGACVARGGNLMHYANGPVGNITYEQFLANNVPGEFLPVVRRRVFERLKFEDDLRGFEGVTWLKAARLGFILHYSHEVLRVYDEEGEDRLCRRSNLLRGANRLTRGWHFFLTEFGADLWGLRPQSYFKVACRWAFYARLQEQCEPEWQKAPRVDAAFARLLAAGIKLGFCVIPRAVWVWCYANR